MINENFDVQFVRVGNFIKRNLPRFRTAEVRIFSDYIQVDYKTSDVVRALPEGSDEVILLAEKGYIVIRYCFYYDDEKEDAK